MIWSFCVPGPRVFEMEIPQWESHSVFPARSSGRGCDSFISPVGRIPVISHVCREAREVALKGHGYVMIDVDDKTQTDEDGAPYPPWTPWHAIFPIRFRRDVDIVHLHWHRAYDWHEYLSVPKYPLPSFQWLANQAGAASVNAELLYPFRPDREDPDIRTTIKNADFRYFSPHVLYYVVLAIVQIHMSEKEAAQTGVFGALGEEPIRLVDPRDTATVTKFRDAWRGRQSPAGEEHDVAELFSRAIDAADKYCARVERWRQGLEKAWLWRKCDELGVLENTRAEIWPTKARSRWNVDWTRRELNREHSWVQKQLALMPRFEPALMFRHCNGGCRLPTPPRRPNFSVFPSRRPVFPAR